MNKYVSRVSVNRSYRNFLRPLSNEETKLDYSYWFKLFVDWAVGCDMMKNDEDFESLLNMKSDDITDVLLDWIDSEKSKGNKGSTISSKICAVELFFEMNRKIWHNKLVRKSIPRDEKEPSGKLPIEDNELRDMLNIAKDLRTIALIHFFASTGVRPFALNDPVLRIKHLVKMDYDVKNRHNDYCYAVMVYDESKEGYWAFLTPEATKALDWYFDWRKREGENLDEESPIFATKNSRHRKRNYLTDNTVREIFTPLVNRTVKRKKIGSKRYDKAIIYMFRKRFNGKLKMENSVNSNIAEKLMAHKRGLDGTYLQPTKEECYREFVKAIPELTVDAIEKKDAMITKQEIQIKQLNQKNAENSELKIRLQSVEKQLYEIRMENLQPHVVSEQ